MWVPIAPLWLCRRNLTRRKIWCLIAMWARMPRSFAGRPMPKSCWPVPRPPGPAFEGAQSQFGQRAAPGAIERVEIDPVTKEPRFQVIGSDLWSDEDGFDAATAVTGHHGHLRLGHYRGGGRDADGRAVGCRRADRVGGSKPAARGRIPDGRTHAYVVHDGSADGGPVITVTQGDIRAIQLAKSALYAGARLLMDEMRDRHGWTASCWRVPLARISRPNTRWCWA